MKKQQGDTKMSVVELCRETNRRNGAKKKIKRHPNKIKKNRIKLYENHEILEFLDAIGNIMGT